MGQPGVWANNMHIMPLNGSGNSGGSNGLKRDSDIERIVKGKQKEQRESLSILFPDG